MHELIVRVLDEIRGAWRFRWAAIGICWAVCIAGWAFVFSLPNVYESTARVYVDSQSVLRQVIKGLAVEPDVDAELALVRQELLSRPRLEVVARETDLSLRAKTPEAQQELITGLQKRILISNDSRAPNSTSDGVYRISFKDVSREKSLEVVQTLLNSFVEDTLSGKREGQQEAQRFLQTEIDATARKLSEAEGAVAEFKKRNVGRMPDDRGDYFSRLQAEMTGAEQQRVALRNADARRSAIERQLSGEEPFIFGMDAAPSASTESANGRGDLAARIRQLEAREQELLLKYTEKHPEVIGVRETIADLQQQQQAEIDRVRKGQQATGSLSQSLKSNPVYQGMRVELNRTEVQLAELREDLAQRDSRVAELRRVVNEVPEVEAELKRLNRDYDQTRDHYQDLLKRLDTARLSENAARTGVVSFQVIDPPSGSFEAVSPKRRLLLLGVLCAAIAAAAGAAYLINQMRPVFYNVRMLAESLGLPVLGPVSRVAADRDRAIERMRMFALSGVAALLLITFGAVFALSESMAHFAERLIG